MKYFSKDHEWVEINDKIATVGISKHATEELGDITYIELPELASVKQGEILTTVESVKAASDIYSPISGTVIKVNEDLEDTPEIVNDSPEKDGWICQLNNINVDELDKLMNKSEYERFLEC